MEKNIDKKKQEKTIVEVTTLEHRSPPRNQGESILAAAPNKSCGIATTCYTVALVIFAVTSCVSVAVPLRRLPHEYVSGDLAFNPAGAPTAQPARHC